MVEVERAVQALTDGESAEEQGLLMYRLAMVYEEAVKLYRSAQLLPAYARTSDRLYPINPCIAQTISYLALPHNMEVKLAAQIGYRGSGSLAMGSCSLFTSTPLHVEFLKLTGAHGSIHCRRHRMDSSTTQSEWRNLRTDLIQLASPKPVKQKERIVKRVMRVYTIFRI